MANIERHPAMASMREAVMRAGRFGTVAAFEALREDGWEVVRADAERGAVDALQDIRSLLLTDDGMPAVSAAWCKRAIDIADAALGGR